LIPQPHLSIHADTYFDDGLRFPARYTGAGFGHVAFPFPGERLPAADATVDPTREEVLQSRFGQRSVGRFRLLGRNSKPSVVLFNQLRQRAIGFLHRADVAQPKFDDQAILKGLPEPFDPSFGLRRQRLDMGNAQIGEGLSKGGKRLRLTGQFLLQGELALGRAKNGVTIAVEGKRHSFAAQPFDHDGDVAFQGFGWAKSCRDDFSGGVIDDAVQGKLRAAILQPGEGGSINLPQHARLRFARPESVSLRTTAQPRGTKAAF